jgi:hypothetical protein
MGMGEREDYLATRLIDDKFIALNKKNELTTWSIATGKVRHEWKLSDNEPAYDYSDFEIYQYRDGHQVFQREWFTKILLMSKKPVS